MSDTEQTQAPEVVDQAVDTHDKKSPQESFAELRKARDDYERQAWQAKKELELVQKQVASQQQMNQQQQSEPEFDFSQLAKEEFPDGKKIFDAFGQINKKLSSYEQKLQEKEVKIQALEFAVEHADFKDIVTPENIEKYIKNDEDNREAVEKSNNPLRKVYNLIKKSAAYQADIVAKTVTKLPSQEQKRVDDKELRPKTGSMGVRSEAVTTAAQISNSRMSKEQKTALWKDTLAASRR